MMNMTKKAILKMVAKVAKVSAEKAAGSASWWGCYQPKEPVQVKKFMKKG